MREARCDRFRHLGAFGRGFGGSFDRTPGRDHNSCFQHAEPFAMIAPRSAHTHKRFVFIMYSGMDMHILMVCWDFYRFSPQSCSRYNHILRILADRDCNDRVLHACDRSVGSATLSTCWRQDQCVGFVQEAFCRTRNIRCYLWNCALGLLAVILKSDDFISNSFNSCPKGCPSIKYS